MLPIENSPHLSRISPTSTLSGITWSFTREIFLKGAGSWPLMKQPARGIRDGLITAAVGGQPPLVAGVYMLHTLFTLSACSFSLDTLYLHPQEQDAPALVISYIITIHIMADNSPPEDSCSCRSCSSRSTASWKCLSLAFSAIS